MKQAEQVEQRSADLKAPSTHRSTTERSKSIAGSSAAVTEEGVGDEHALSRVIQCLG